MRRRLICSVCGGSASHSFTPSMGGFYFMCNDCGKLRKIGYNRKFSHTFCLSCDSSLYCNSANDLEGRLFCSNPNCSSYSVKNIINRYDFDTHKYKFVYYDKTLIFIYDETSKMYYEVAKYSSNCRWEVEPEYSIIITFVNSILQNIPPQNKNKYYKQVIPKDCSYKRKYNIRPEIRYIR